MNDVGETIRDAAARLAKTSDVARLDAELLMAHALGVTRSEMLLWHMAKPAPPGFTPLFARRLAHEPAAYIMGEAEFYGRRFIVTPAVLIPRGDSESVVAAALEACPAPRRALDCGTGSGVLLLTVLAEGGASGIGVDASPAALAVARQNADALGLAARSEFHRRDWTARGWAADLGRFDLIVANPPYVESDAALDPCVSDHEPHAALFAGPDGLDDYRVLIPQLEALLEPGGVAVLEIGARQAAAVGALAQAAGAHFTVRQDLAGRDRAVILRWGLGKGG